MVFPFSSSLQGSRSSLDPFKGPCPYGPHVPSIRIFFLIMFCIFSSPVHNIVVSFPSAQMFKAFCSSFCADASSGQITSKTWENQIRLWKGCYGLLDKYLLCTFLKNKDFLFSFLHVLLTFL